MNIVGAGDRFMVYGEDVKTYKVLPADTYKVQFNKMTGFYLISHNDLTVDEKVYGPYARKVQKVMNTFKHLDRNMGVILSGPKGVGKSMFARLLAEAGKNNNLPLIIVDCAVPGVEDFISSIEQECIVLFDEFEKTFKPDKDNGFNPQENLLSLFDGIDNGKKLYVVTCNETRDLNSYLLNRPGRFHYHFIMGTPTGDEVREYMEDNLVGDARQYIDKVVALSAISAFTYDVLRAVAFELNQGYDLSETMMDLNIERERYLNLTMKVIFTNGYVANARDVLDLDMFNNRYNYEWCQFEKNTIPDKFKKYCDAVNVRFYTRDVVVDDKGYHLEPEKTEIVWDDDWNYMDDDTAEQQAYKAEVKQFMDSFEVAEVVLEKAKPMYGSTAFAYKYLV